MQSKLSDQPMLALEAKKRKNIKERSVKITKSRHGIHADKN